MSNAAIDWAVEQDVKGPAKCVLIVLANRANGGQTCWPSLDRISRESGVSKRTVQNALVALEKAALISKSTNGRGNIYTVQLTQEVPQLTQEVPQSTDAAPAMTDAAPASTDAAPALTDAAPATKPKVTQSNPKEPSRRFAPPSVSEVSKFMVEKGSGFSEAEAFVNFYESKNWMVGKNKMKNWKAAASGWIARKRQRGELPEKPETTEERKAKSERLLAKFSANE